MNICFLVLPSSRNTKECGSTSLSPEEFRLLEASRPLCSIAFGKDNFPEDHRNVRILHTDLKRMNSTFLEHQSDTLYAHENTRTRALSPFLVLYHAPWRTHTHTQPSTLFHTNHTDRHAHTPLHIDRLSKMTYQPAGTLSKRDGERGGGQNIGQEVVRLGVWWGRQDR